MKSVSSLLSHLQKEKHKCLKGNNNSRGDVKRVSCTPWQAYWVKAVAIALPPWILLLVILIAVLTGDHDIPSYYTAGVLVSAVS